MITYQITRFIHSVIRRNKLIHIVDALLETSHKNENVLDDLIFQFKRFLRKENDEIFEQHRLKYVTYLDDFKIHVSDMKELSKKDTIQINSLLLEIYEIPKKRNNFLSLLLFYFYCKNHRHLHGKVIFKAIYLYFLIITYRNRLSDEMRANILHMDTEKFTPVMTLWRELFARLQKKYHLPSMHIIFMASMFLCVILLSIASWRYGPAALHLQADIGAAVQSVGGDNGLAFGKVALDSLMLGRVTDSTIIQDFGMQNILIVALLAVIIQSLRVGVTNLFVNSFLMKMFSVFGTMIKFLFHAIFAVYNYVIYKLATKYIFLSIDFILSRGILPNPIFFSLFLGFYFLIYISVITAYIFIATFFISWNPTFWIVMIISISISILLIAINLHSDIGNFRAFIVELENIFKNLHEAEKVEASKTA